MKKFWKKLKKFIRKTVTKIHDKPLAPPTDRELKLIEEFRTAFRGLAPIETDNCSLSEKEWLNNAKTLKQFFLNEDPREFLRWHVISSTMSVTHAEYTASELKYLKKRPGWAAHWPKTLREVSAGHPLPYYKYPKTSANLIHHAYHWAQFEEKTGLGIDDISSIFELGGGYGSMCRLLHNLGFTGNYIIFDIAAFSLLQRFFLESIGIKTSDFGPLQSEDNTVICGYDIEHLKKTIINRNQKSNSVFIATWSISETPADIRNLILPLISSFDAFLISYQYSFQEMNNINFFESWKKTLNNCDWYEWEIEHLPGNRYLFGRSKK